jgi:phage terminase small subunit
MPQKKKLTPKQEMFTREYLIDLNATQAAIRSGYSKKTAEWIGPQLLGKSHVAEAIQSAMDKRAAKIEITSDAVLQELAKMAFANIQDLYDEFGILKPINELPREVAAGIQSVKVNLTEACAVQEVKLWDKKGSLELLGKHLKLFAEVGSKENPIFAVSASLIASMSDDEIEEELKRYDAISESIKI